MSVFEHKIKEVNFEHIVEQLKIDRIIEIQFSGHGTDYYFGSGGVTFTIKKLSFVPENFLSMITKP